MSRELSNASVKKSEALLYSIIPENFSEASSAAVSCPKQAVIKIAGLMSLKFLAHRCAVINLREAGEKLRKRTKVENN